jgi:hypothetical protein
MPARHGARGAFRGQASDRVAIDIAEGVSRRKTRIQCIWRTSGLGVPPTLTSCTCTVPSPPASSTMTRHSISPLLVRRDRARPCIPQVSGRSLGQSVDAKLTVPADKFGIAR